MKIPFVTKFYEERFNEYQNKLLANQIEEVHNIYMTMRGWRHDYHNHLQSMKAYLQLGRIAVDYKAVCPPKLTVSDIDLCVLIGNLIDNAVESCEKIQANQMKEKDTNLTPFIRIYIGTFRGQLYVSVSNATNEVVRKLDEEYITKKRGNHGHGLKRINLVVEKYGGYINRQNEPGVFATEIMLPL